jgi:hypothetical protein
LFFKIVPNRLTFFHLFTSCWLPLDSNLIYSEYTPICLLLIMTIMVVESANNVDDDSMPPLDGKW